MHTFVLVHGSWHGAWCWEKIIPLLKAQGHKVYAPDLPGHGKDSTPLQQISLNTYTEALIELLEKISEPVILVGHSMAGIVISQVAELKPESIKRLIYVAAFLPQNGQSMFDVARCQPPTRFVKMMRSDNEKNSFTFNFEAMRDFAYHQCDEATYLSLKSRFCADPLAPLQTRVNLTSENFGRIPKVYIECLNDKAILKETQRKMHQSLLCKVFSLTCDHSPFYSDPEGLARLFLQ